MHLTAYLGYLLGTNGDKKCKYVIISKDNDYDNVITFLKEIHRSADIARHPKMDLYAYPKWFFKIYRQFSIYFVHVNPS